MTAYYQLIERTIDDNGVTTTQYKSTPHAQGAWNENEQHMGPATGILCAELEQFNPRDEMRIGRISLDIFGMIHFGDFEVVTKVIRGGRTIELVEASLIANDKICVVARAWRMLTSDTTEVHGLEDERISHPEDLPNWDGMAHWGGGFIRSITTHASPDRRAGSGVVWVHTPVDMVAGQPTTDFVKLMGLVDTANGVVPRIQQDTSTGHIEWLFPNIDLQIHMHRIPQGQWLGLETIQQIGTDGIGLTSSVLHDVHGVFGRSEQILTVRKLVSE